MLIFKGYWNISDIGILRFGKSWSDKRMKLGSVSKIILAKLDLSISVVLTDHKKHETRQYTIVMHYLIFSIF